MNISREYVRMMRSPYLPDMVNYSYYDASKDEIIPIYGDNDAFGYSSREKAEKMANENQYYVIKTKADYYAIFGKKFNEQANGIFETSKDPATINAKYVASMNVPFATNGGEMIYYNPSGNIFVYLEGVFGFPAETLINYTKVERGGENFGILSAKDYYAVIGEKVWFNKPYPILPKEILKTS